MNSDITIKIDGICSVRKSELGKHIGVLLKDMGFGKVKMVGKDKRGAYLKGLISDDSIEIKINDQTVVSPSILDYHKMKLNETF